MSKTILLADDSVTIQKVVELTFLEEDYEVITVGDGDEALARFSEAKPDLVIADVHMPGADGYEVCRRVKEKAPDLPVLLLVGTFEAFDAAEADRSGADRHLKKPFESRDLQRLAEELIGVAAQAAAAPPPAPATAVEAPRAAEAEPAPAAAAAPAGGAISDEDVERIARRVAEILGDRAVRDVAWEVIPDLAEVVIKDRLRELEGQVD